MELQRKIDLADDEVVAILEDQTVSARPLIRDTPLDGPIVWDRDTLAPDDGVIRISPDCLAEIDAFVARLTRNPLPTLLLAPADYDMPLSRAMMAQARDILDNGVGFVVLDKLPVQEWTVEQSTAVYWMLAQMCGRPVAQSFDGKMIYDVRNVDRPYSTSVRGDTTNRGQNFHTDNNWNLCPPHFVALFCLHPAKSGGINSIVSFYAAYNEMLKRHPIELVERLYHPFLANRQREHVPGDPMVLSRPLFTYDGKRMNCKLSRHQTLSGYHVAGREIDALGMQAIEALESIMEEDRFNREFFFERGQIQIVDNRRCGHRRTAFEDYDEPERRRHLLRIWLRDEGARSYQG
ncbi:TauD/TfdA family dioxygenase [Bordetella genomosp. 13]|uniref:TauD/TfdA family dioxygenase n=1 Tax=Bordetella genomosp. 13 TaxID=463040 RepID=UPI0016426ABF|nr:TauD/TfdA family dioxygenase [Bordetella genomosp. 13]